MLTHKFLEILIHLDQLIQQRMNVRIWTHICHILQNVYTIKHENNNVLFSKTDENSEIKFIDTKSVNEMSTHIVFKSKVSGEIISATMRTSNKRKIGGFMLDRKNSKEFDISNENLGAINSSIVINLPKGQIVMENNTMSVMTANKFAKISFFEGIDTVNKVDYKQFQVLFEEVTYDSDYLEFTNALNEISMQKFSLACFSARTALVAANTALALSLGSAVLTGGTATPLVVGSVLAVGLAEEAVNDACGE